MKSDLFNTILFRISSSEFSLFGEEEEELRVHKISKCEGPDPLFGLASIFDRKQKENNQMLTCEDWIIKKKGNRE